MKEFNDNLTVKLLRGIGSPFVTKFDSCELEESKELFEYAFKNKMALLYLDVLKKQGVLHKLVSEYEKQSIRCRETLITAVNIAKLLTAAGADYVIYKTLRSFPSTPNDVDVIIFGTTEDFEAVLDVIREAQYIELEPIKWNTQTLFADPRGAGIVHIDKRGGSYYVDIYKEAGTDYFIYMDKRKLTNHVVENKVLDGEMIKTLRPEIELAAICMHTVFPEKTFPLELFYTITYAVYAFEDEQIERLLAFANENHMQIALKVCLSLTADLHQKAFNTRPKKLAELVRRIGYLHSETKQMELSDLEMPHIISAKTFWLAFFEKLLEPNALRSLFVQLVHMLNPFFAKTVFKSLIDRLTKGKYHHV